MCFYLRIRCTLANDDKRERGTRTLWWSLPNHSQSTVNSIVTLFFRYSHTAPPIFLIFLDVTVSLSIRLLNPALLRDKHKFFFLRFSRRDFFCLSCFSPGKIRCRQFEHTKWIIRRREIVFFFLVFAFSRNYFGDVLPLRPLYLHWRTMRFLFNSSLFRVCVVFYDFSSPLSLRRSYAICCCLFFSLFSFLFGFSLI